jgi:hypothetical protein
MMDWVQRKTMAAAAITAVVALTGCTSTGTSNAPAQAPAGAMQPADPGAMAANGDPVKVVTGVCPQVTLREGTAYLRKYAGKAKDDPTKLIIQASLAETTRQCTTNDGGMIMITVMAQGRLVAGPMGKSGSYTLPIRVAVIEGDKPVYSELVKMNAELPAGQPSGQFLFSKTDVAVPAGIGSTAQIFIGFDEGPYNTK